MKSGAEGRAANVDRLIDAVEELHSPPTIVYELLQVLQDPEFRVAQVEQLLNADPALATSVLKLVNSSSFGLRSQIGSLRQAVAFLGARTLRLAILGFGLTNRLTRGAPAEVCCDYWRRALTMASAAARLGARGRALQREQAYLAGLLADLGVLVLTQVETTRYVPLYRELGHGPELTIAEREEFGASHPELAERLLRRWNLPRDIAAAVAGHHDAPDPSQPLSRLVYAGNLFADLLWTPGTSYLDAARRYFQNELDIDLDDLITLAVECKQDVLSHADAFRVDLQGSIDCEALRNFAFKQYKAEAIEIALDWDSAASVLQHDAPSH